MAAAVWLLVAPGLVACSGDGDARSGGAAPAPDARSGWAGLRVRVIGDATRSTAPVLVLLHGLAADAESLVPMARQLVTGRRVRVVLPEAPLSRAWGGRAWWRLHLQLRPEALVASTRDLSGAIDGVPPGLPIARRRILDLLGEVQRRLGAAPERIVIGGYSQGAILAVDVGLHADGPLAGLVGMSGTLLALPVWRARLAARRGMHAFLSHGRQDRLLPYDKGVQLRELLRDGGLQVTWVPYDGAHANSPLVTPRLGAFLDRVFPSEVREGRVESASPPG